MIRALIVDDERLARSELRRLLDAHDDIEIVGEAANAQEARTLMEKLQPALLFLDVEMPGESGIALIESLPDPPDVIFTTAYSQYAVEAFEQCAVDYLLKPIEAGRLARALHRIRELRAQNAREVPQQFFVREGERAWMVRPADIRLLESEGNYTRVCFGEHRPLVLRSLQALQERLGKQFFRANRNQVINLRWVESMELNPDLSLTAVLRDGTRVGLSRRQSQIFREQMAL
ncbi:LytR/AlgR family response regulator transcription factor [Pseudacidobacterium ailaaui]|jgi:two-component system LytT family response regulator|uniref:LytR/AlgR family response regulator transcription factor n=1 Tax=Pseudacidobacterium ailaaui TaxID=1382359 RepID=UPI000B15B3D1|nr:LytTR family DNA-binding domain-containing protein [Pseudacidobacterium ailaaui]MCL6463238.1 LytTR family DNA-binding domain-containing protein [Pseudacidobacterium ailaaui]